MKGPLNAPGFLLRWVGVGCALIAAAHAARAQTRDAAKPEHVGTALISGVVVTDETPARPLRRVAVTLSETGNAIMSRLATTDDGGRFTFRNLPPGRYTISANRPPFLIGAYGARRPAGPGSVQTGTAIVLARGQQILDLAVKLLPGAIITGTLRDVDGQPARGFAIGVAYFPRSTATGERTLSQYYSGLASSVYTDDRGVYRIFGLPPGEYVVSATSAMYRATDAVPTTDADVQRALSLIQRPAPANTPPPAAPSRRQSVGYAAVYYPGTTIPTQATTIALGVGEERSAVDFQMQLVSTTRVEGTITGPDGAPAAGVPVRASRTVAAPMDDYYYDYGGSASTSDAQGRFALSGLTPGSVVISARKPPALWASAELTAQGDDAVVSLMLASGTTVSGRILADTTSGTAAPPLPDYTRARVTLAPVGPSPTASAIGMPLQADGRFSLVGVSPGRYRLTASLGVPASERWFVRSAMLNGQEALDAVEIRPGADIADAVITVTDRPTEISGRMTDAGNNPAPEYFIILFPADRSLWTTGARRIRQVRPSRDGTFSFKNLPAGEYRLAAVTDVEQGEWFDPAFLGQLFDASIRITLAEHATITQDIRIR